MIGLGRIGGRTGSSMSCLSRSMWSPGISQMQQIPLPQLDWSLNQCLPGVRLPFAAILSQSLSTSDRSRKPTESQLIIGIIRSRIQVDGSL